jgi:hypothetical protein
MEKKRIIKERNIKKKQETKKKRKHPPTPSHGPHALVTISDRR